MASAIRELLEGRNDLIDFEAVLARFPWIAERDKNCIISPDSDGMLCGLFMARYFNWKVVGYYDGKVLLLKNGISCYHADTVFLDMEIFRGGVKSMGQHMVMFNKKKLPATWSNFDLCLQPSLLREYDFKSDFRLKYPLATIHFLIAIASKRIELQIPVSAIAPLFFVDGTFQVLYGYPENVINWLNYLRINDEGNILRQIFMHEHYTVYSQINAMIDFFIRRDDISIPKERGDKFVISNDDNDFHNTVIQENGFYKIEDGAKEKVVKFIQLLSETTGWNFTQTDWSFQDLRRYKFTGSDFESRGWTMSNRDFEKFISLSPMSWAMTSNNNAEFTIEAPDTLP